MTGILIQTLQFFASLSMLVLIHEFGHFITARMFGIRVDKFYIFFNPWFSLWKRKIGSVEYGIGWLPLGGYVSLYDSREIFMDEESEATKQNATTYPAYFKAGLLSGTSITTNGLMSCGSLYTGGHYGTWKTVTIAGTTINYLGY